MPVLENAALGAGSRDCWRSLGNGFELPHCSWPKVIDSIDYFRLGGLRCSQPSFGCLTTLWVLCYFRLRPWERTPIGGFGQVGLE
jgi:hypothetical protein